MVKKALRFLCWRQAIKVPKHGREQIQVLRGLLLGVLGRHALEFFIFPVLVPAGLHLIADLHFGEYFRHVPRRYIRVIYCDRDDGVIVALVSHSALRVQAQQYGVSVIQGDGSQLRIDPRMFAHVHASARCCRLALVQVTRNTGYQCPACRRGQINLTLLHQQLQRRKPRDDD